MLLGEEVDDRFRQHLAHPVDGKKLCPRLAFRIGGGAHLLLEMVERAVASREKTRIGLADMADAEREDVAVELDLAAFIDGVEKFLRRGRSPAFPVLQLLEGALVAFLQR